MVSRDKLALNCMLWRMDCEGNWPLAKVNGALSYKDEKHDGDCTHQCYTCMRCECDMAYKQADQILLILQDKETECYSYLDKLPYS